MSSSISDDAETLVTRVHGDARFHADDDLLALAYDAAGTLWSVEEPGVLRSWDEAGRCTNRAELIEVETSWFFSPHARYLAAACDELLLWDVATQKQIARLEVPSWVTAVAFHPSRPLVATGHDDGVIRLWEIGQSDPIAELAEHELPVSALAFHADGVRLASAGEDRVIKIWDIATGRQIVAMTGHTDRIPAITWQPGSECLVSVGWDATARVWDVATGEPRILLNTHDDQVLALAFTADGSLLATADSASTVHLWGDLLQAQSLRKLPGFSEEIRGLAFRADGARLAVGGTDRVIHVYDAKSGELLAGDAGDRRHAIAIWDQHIVSTAGNGGLQLFPPAPSPLPAGRYTHVCSSPDGRWLAAVSPTDFIQLYDATTKSVKLVDGPKSAPRFLSFTPDSQTLSGAIANEGTVWLWNPETGEPTLLVVEATEGCSVEAIAWHPNGRWLLAGGLDFMSTSGSTGRVCLWDVTEKKRLVSIELGAQAVAFDPTAERFAFAGIDGYVDIHETEFGKPLCRLDTGDEQSIYAVAFSPCGKYIVAGGVDGILRTWQIDTEELLSSHQFRSPIDDLIARADGTLLVAHQNGTVSELPLRRLTDEP